MVAYPRRAGGRQLGITEHLMVLTRAQGRLASLLSTEEEENTAPAQEVTTATRNQVEMADRSDFDAKMKAASVQAAFNNIPNFKGAQKDKDDVSVKVFCDLIDSRAVICKVPNECILPFVIDKMVDEAGRWFLQEFFGDNELKGRDLTWNTLKPQLLRRYQTENDNIKNCQALNDLRQGQMSISDYTDEFNKLVSFFPKLDESYVICLYICYMKWEYASAVMTNPENLKTLALAQSAAKLQDGKIGNPRNAVNVAQSRENKRKREYTGNSPRDKSSLTCYRCQQKGHLARECPNPNPVSREGQNSARAACNKSPKTLFILDSGCTKHMVHKKEYLSHCRPHHEGITVADGAIIEAIGIGSMIIKTSQGDIEIPDVLWVPTLDQNLLSFRQLMLQGMTPKLFKNSANIELNGTEIARGPANNAEYLIELELVYGAAARAANAKINLMLLHQRLGHPGKNRMRRQLKAMGIEMEYDDDEIKCEACIQGKMTQTPFPTCTKRGKWAAEITHADVCGPIRGESLNNAMYFLILVDDHSRHIYLNLLNNKRENTVLECVQEYMAWCQRQSGNRARVFRSDNGTEFQATSQWLREQGIEHQRSIPYTPAQNGRAERNIRTVLDATRTLLCDSKLPVKFWPAATITATHVLNRTTNSSGKSPLQLMKNRETPHNLDYLRRFGCKAQVRIPCSTKPKFVSRTVAAFFIGYGLHTKAWRFWCPDSDNVIESRDAIFAEHKVAEMCDPGAYTFLDQVEDEEQDSGRQQVAPTNDRVRTGELEVRRILDERPRGRGKQYFVEWSDPGEKASWEPAAALADCVALDVWEGTARQARCDPDVFTVDAALSSPDRDLWVAAMAKELASLANLGVYEPSEAPPGVKPLSCRWVLRRKRDEAGNIACFKARLVVRGFLQRPGIDYEETFAPTLSRSALRILLAVAASRRWTLRQMDVETAFLHGEIDSDIFVSFPGVCPGDDSVVGSVTGNHVWKLKKALYGLRQSPRLWFKKLSDTLRKVGWQLVTLESCMYVRRDSQNKVKAALAFYVDDILIAGPTNDLDSYVEELKAIFKIKDLGRAKFILGIHVNQLENFDIELYQTRYIEDMLKRHSLSQLKGVALPMDVNDSCADTGINDKLADEKLATTFREIVGGLLYASTSTRLDIASAVGLLSRKMCKPSIRNVNQIKRVLRYLSGTRNKRLIFKSNNGGALKITAWTDSDWAGEVAGRSSTSGIAVCINNTAVTWRSSRQNCISRSSVEAEFVAAAETAGEVTWVQRIVSELTDQHQIMTPIFMDSEGARALAENGTPTRRTKHIEVSYFYTHQCINNGIITLKHVDSANNAADILTKPLGTNLFAKHTSTLGLSDVCEGT
jgi:transposase InsO family protein